MKRHGKILSLILLFLLCGSINHVHAKETSAVSALEKQAKEAARRSAEDTLAPNEIEMIEYRRILMGRPGLQLYVVFFNDVGQPIEYFVTKGKCSSSKKRLTESWKFERGQTGTDDDGSVYGDFVVPTASEDGTFGSSDDYIFCKTADGKYKQWNGKYYISDSPIELTIKPIVINIGNKNQSQY